MKRLESLLAEQTENDRGSKIIGLTLETRPDTITDEKGDAIHGCTRVQLGVQHVDDTEKVNRGMVERSLGLH